MYCHISENAFHLIFLRSHINDDVIFILFVRWNKVILINDGSV